MMRTALAITSGAVLLTGCQFGGLNSLNMPGTAGHGEGSYKSPSSCRMWPRCRRTRR